MPAGNAAYSIQTAAMETPDLMKTAQPLLHKSLSLVIRWLFRPAICGELCAGASYPSSCRILTLRREIEY